MKQDLIKDYAIEINWNMPKGEEIRFLGYLDRMLILVRKKIIKLYRQNLLAGMNRELSRKLADEAGSKIYKKIKTRYER